MYCNFLQGSFIHTNISLYEPSLLRGQRQILVNIVFSAIIPFATVTRLLKILSFSLFSFLFCLVFLLFLERLYFYITQAYWPHFSNQSLFALRIPEVFWIKHQLPVIALFMGDIFPGVMMIHLCLETDLLLFCIQIHQISHRSTQYLLQLPYLKTSFMLCGTFQSKPRVEQVFRQCGGK